MADEPVAACSAALSSSSELATSAVPPPTKLVQIDLGRLSLEGLSPSVPVRPGLSPVRQASPRSSRPAVDRYGRVRMLVRERL